MGTANIDRKGSGYWWPALLVLCLISCTIPIACNGDPRAIVAGIPDGSKLSELDEYIGTFYDTSDVSEWTPGNSKASKKTKFGSYDVRKLGPYDGWTASKAARDGFTGQLEFFHHSWAIPDDFAPSYVVSLIYVKGVLKEKNFWIVPG